jgi:hypothetical protein
VTKFGGEKLNMRVAGEPTRDECGIAMTVPHNGKKETVRLGWRPIFRMLFEFQEPQTVIDQTIEMWQQASAEA